MIKLKNIKCNPIYLILTLMNVIVDIVGFKKLL